jgi:hypothetical protein
MLFSFEQQSVRHWLPIQLSVGIDVESQVVILTFLGEHPEFRLKRRRSLRKEIGLSICCANDIANLENRSGKAIGTGSSGLASPPARNSCALQMGRDWRKTTPLSAKDLSVDGGRWKCLCIVGGHN